MRILILLLLSVPVWGQRVRYREVITTKPIYDTSYGQIEQYVYAEDSTISRIISNGMTVRVQTWEVHHVTPYRPSKPDYSILIGDITMGFYFSQGRYKRTVDAYQFKIYR